MKDVLGNELKAGDRIVYATRVSSSMKLTEATVLALAGEKVRVQPAPRYGVSRKSVLLGEPRYIVRVEEAK